MHKQWQKIARRIVQGLGVQPGELIDVRDGSGSLDLLLEIALCLKLRSQHGGKPSTG